MVDRKTNSFQLLTCAPENAMPGVWKFLISLLMLFTRQILLENAIKNEVFFRYMIDMKTQLYR